jgi:hypothetical protein
MIESDLKIGQFIYDKAVVAGASGEATSNKVTTPPYSQFQFELTFSAAFSGNITPTWKFTRTTVNGTGNLFSATRTNTQYVLITLGKESPQTAALHNAALTGNATGTGVQSLMRGF